MRSAVLAVLVGLCAIAGCVEYDPPSGIKVEVVGSFRASIEGDTATSTGTAVFRTERVDGAHRFILDLAGKDGKFGMTLTREGWIPAPEVYATDGAEGSFSGNFSVREDGVSVSYLVESGSLAVETQTSKRITGSFTLKGRDQAGNDVTISGTFRATCTGDCPSSPDQTPS